MTTMFEVGLQSEGYTIVEAFEYSDEEPDDDETSNRDSSDPEIDDNDEEENDRESETEEQKAERRLQEMKKLNTKVFREVVSSIPGLRDSIERFKAKPKGLRLLVKDFSKTARAARASDTSKLKQAIVMYIPENIKTQTVNPPLANPSDGNKDDRGFTHPMIAPFLCPFDEYPEYLRDSFSDINEKRKFATAASMPMFMYDLTMYDPANRESGFARGYLFIRVYSHLFRGQSSVFEIPEEKKGRKCNAKTYGQFKVTKETIAYAACQARYALSTRNRWRPRDGAFSYPKFYQKVCMFFADEDDLWVIETMEWLNKCIFGNQEEDDDANVILPDDDTDDEMRQIRDVRRKRREEAMKKAAAEKAAAASTRGDVANTDGQVGDVDNARDRIADDVQPPRTVNPSAPLISDLGVFLMHTCCESCSHSAIHWTALLIPPVLLVIVILLHLLYVFAVESTFVFAILAFNITQANHGLPILDRNWYYQC
ncbi:hypothetical protein K435DRAFT_793431 [Dendrothele bispora CBS 962.96]|uniref:Uncharacterized protein n=1 Tax=Dendrothele bispora (strain CBS 962.96) TaxID=1314807 RepID=A0A4S8MGM1_DENBC|nr:hypothetical protein K435DRAFT_793431 [Dendrothele bispora CBS 962.96]